MPDEMPFKVVHLFEYLSGKLDKLKDQVTPIGAQVLGVACPQCAVMFADAVKVENLEGKLEVKEISEIVNERIA